MKPIAARQVQKKQVFVIEADPVRQSEIKDALSHQTEWSILFFADVPAALQKAALHPMVVFLDVEHFAVRSSDTEALSAIGAIRKALPYTELIVFCDSGKEHEAAATLKKGASDYIVLNQHQFTRMESELNWMGRVLDQRQSDKKTLHWLIIIAIGLMLLFLILVGLDMMGYIREGRPDVLIEH